MNPFTPYVQHKPGCELLMSHAQRPMHPKCTCGLEEALKAEKEKDASAEDEPLYIGAHGRGGDIKHPTPTEAKTEEKLCSKCGANIAPSGHSRMCLDCGFRYEAKTEAENILAKHLEMANVPGFIHEITEAGIVPHLIDAVREYAPTHRPEIKLPDKNHLARLIDYDYTEDESEFYGPNRLLNFGLYLCSKIKELNNK